MTGMRTTVTIPADALDELARLRAEVRMLREALEAYAMDSNWYEIEGGTIWNGDNPTEIARDALGMEP